IDRALFLYPPFCNQGSFWSEGLNTHFLAYQSLQGYWSVNHFLQVDPSASKLESYAFSFFVVSVGCIGND
ncbi:MAG: hypothetical protein ACPHL6_02460, partial [Rubripirellula sp.]